MENGVQRGGFRLSRDLEGEFAEEAFVALVEEAEDAVNVVHICPEWFAGPQDIGLRRGDRVNVKGVWAEIDGKDVFMASKIKIDPHFEFKVRLTKNGFPFWAMSPEQLAHERAESLKAQGIEVDTQKN